MIAVAIARDYDGLKQAALELLEEAFAEPENERLQRIAEHAANSDEILAGIESPRTLAEGYYVRVGYLLELEAMTQLGIELKPENVEFREMQGLIALRDARMEFKRIHPPCRGCGKPLSNSGLERCSDCETAALQAAAGSPG